MWDKYKVEKDKSLYWKIGDTAFWVKKEDKEWLVAKKSIIETNKQAVFIPEHEAPAEVEWNSIIADKNSSLNVLPALPDRPVVVKPKSTFKLLPGSNTQLYIHIPLWVQFYHGSAKNDNLIFEHPSIDMSSTWFGETENGILAYSNPRQFFTSLDKSRLLDYEAICPLKITNNDEAILNFQRLLINVEFLNIYSENNLLFTNEIVVKFKGENVVADIQYTQSAPAFLENAKRLSSPRNPERKNVLKKSFHFIKSLTEY